MTPATVAALELHARGANVLPLRPADKKPAQPFKVWTRRPQSPEDVARLFHNHAGNVGALGGVHSDARADGYLAYIDCDTAQSFEMFGALIASSYGETLTTRSARGGHYWIRTDEPIRTRKVEGGELRGRGSYVAAPPSLHPSGVLYRFVDPDAPILRIDELPGLTFETWAATAPATTSAINGACPDLPSLARLIYNNDAATISRYESRSEVDFALMLSLVHAGFTFEQVVQVFKESRHDSHLDCRHRGFERRLRAEFERALKQAGMPKSPQVAAMVGVLRDWALNTMAVTGDWGTRETDRNAMLAMLDFAGRSGANAWYTGRRHIEESARMSSPTAQKAMQRLAGVHLFERVKTGDHVDATTWTFGRTAHEILRNAPNLPHTHTDTSTPSLTETSPPAPQMCRSGLVLHTSPVLAHPVFEHSGLGRHAARTFAAIIDTPLTEVEIVAVTGAHRTTVSRHIERLAHQGLVAIRTGQRWQALPANLDDTAIRLDVADIPTKRKARIARERDNWRRRMSEKDKARVDARNEKRRGSQ